MFFESTVPLAHMVNIVENYIYKRKAVTVKIINPKNDKEVQLLGIAYDIALEFYNNYDKRETFN